MNKNFTKYEKTNLVKKINIANVYTIHYFKYGQNFDIEGESHDFYELVYIDSGSAIIYSNDRKITLEQGEAFLHFPNQYHNIKTDKKFSNSVIISFDCKSSALKNLKDKILTFSKYDKLLLNKIISETTLGYTDKLNDIYLKKMTKKADRPFCNDQIIKNCIELLLISIIRAQKDIPLVTNENQINEIHDDIIQGVLNIVKEKLDSATNINLNEISYRLGFSKSHIKAQFKKKMGTSILQYFISLKIEKAKKMLSQQKYTISEIADQLGFGSIHYFSKQFKLHTNMSPSKYVSSINIDNLL